MLGAHQSGIDSFGTNPHQEPVSTSFLTYQVQNYAGIREILLRKKGTVAPLEFLDNWSTHDEVDH